MSCMGGWSGRRQTLSNAEFRCRPVGKAQSLSAASRMHSGYCCRSDSIDLANLAQRRCVSQFSQFIHKLLGLFHSLFIERWAYRDLFVPRPDMFFDVFLCEE